MKRHIKIIGLLLAFFFILFILIVISEMKVAKDRLEGYILELDGSRPGYCILLTKVDTIRQGNFPYNNEGAFIKYHNENESVDTEFISCDGWVIGPSVDEDMTSFGDTFVLVAQKPLDSICDCNEECSEKKYRNTPHRPTLQKCEDAIENSTFYQYWIINKKTNDIYGPLSMSAYLRKRKELGVPENLQFND